MKYALITFGCRVNQADSLAAEDELRSAGAIASDSPSNADVVIVNTCAVTATAEQSARQAIRRVARENPHVRVVVTGCYATRCPGEVSHLPNVVRLVSNHEKHALVPLLGRDEGWTTAERYGEGEGACGETIGPGLAGRTAFTLRVQTGCDEACSYCIIPSTRGTPRSVRPGEVLRQIARVEDAGYKEVALTGVHLGAYGRDLDPPASLPGLLAAIAESSRLLVRISSLEPMDCTPAVVGLVAECGVFAPHLHLPLQHASRAMLRAMRRPYSIDQYAALVDRIRARIPECSIGTDVIAGFPGETDADVEALATYLAGSPLTHVHVFPYSDRPGTAAASMCNRPAGQVVRERATRLRAIGRQLADRFRLSQLGTKHRALTLEDGRLAVTGNYLKVRIPPGHARNEWVDLVVTGVEAGGLVGRCC